jgi:hypothetical protein
MSATCARGDSIPWGYSAANGDIYNSNNASQSSSIHFAGASGVATGNSGIILYNMTATSTASAASPDSFASVPFHLSFSLVDIQATGSTSSNAKSTDMVNLSGFFSASNVTRQSLFPGAGPWSSPPLFQVVLGGDDVGWRTYSVELASFTSPGQPGGSPGAIQALVTITPADAPTGSGESAPTAAPEPSSLLLAGLGGVQVLAIWRRCSFSRSPVIKTAVS